MRTFAIRRNLYRIIIIFLLILFFQSQSHAITKYILEDLGVGGARGINEHGQVAASLGDQAVIWENGTITILGPGGGVDINESGEVVGRSDGKDVLWENGSMVDLGTTDLDSSAMAINNKTQVVGYQQTTDAGNPYHAWLWDSVNRLQDIDTTGYSSAYDINDNEIVVGRCGSPSHYPAFWQDGVMTQIGTSTGQAQGINNLNQVVGAYAGHAFLWEDGVMTDLGTIGTANSDAKAINENGQVVGQLTFPGGVEYAMFWQDGEMFDLNDLISSDSDFVLTNACDINNKGQIVCSGKIGVEGHAFLLTPISDVSVDIMPRNCPNECPIKGGGSVEVAILGTVDFDVNDIDIASVRLEGVAPTRSSLKDKSTPVSIPADECDCTTDGRDGFIDLCLKFDKKAIISALGEVNVDEEYCSNTFG